MWNCYGYIVFFISILLCKNVSSVNENYFEDFKGVDSDFDLRRAVENFKIEDYKNMTEDMFRMTDLGPKPNTEINITSVEMEGLLKKGKALMDSPVERKLAKLRRSIIEREAKRKTSNNVTSTTNITEKKPKGKKRVKRQGKFQEAAKVDNLKVFRIYLTMFKNLWSSPNVGGAHPLDKQVPKPVCILFKHRIMQFLFPPIGDDKFND